MPNWYDLEQYKQQELGYCLKLATGPSEQTSLFYAQYSLALSYHQLHLDAVRLAAESKNTPLCQGVATVVEAMAEGTIPPADLEYPPLLEQMAEEAVGVYMRKRALRMHSIHKRISTTQAREMIGDLGLLQGLYSESGGYLDALEIPDVPVPDTLENELDLLSRASMELNNPTSAPNSGPHRLAPSFSFAGNAANRQPAP